MRRLRSSKKTWRFSGKKGQKVMGQWLQYRHGLYSCLLWWGIGAGIGFLFSVSLTSEMKQSLAQHLESSIDFLLDEKSSAFTYFWKRCWAYSQVLLLICCLENFIFGYIGLRILMLGSGFVYGFSQIPWIQIYGLKGIVLALSAYFTHQLVFVAVAAWGEWLMKRQLAIGKVNARQIAMWILVCVPVIAGIEAYGSPALFRACM